MQKHWITTILAAAFALAPGCRTGGMNGEMSAFDADASTRDADATSTTQATATKPVTSSPSSTPVTTANAPNRVFVDKAELGETAPEFSLTDVHGRTYRLSQFKDRMVVLEWFNPSCSYCIDAYKEGGALRELSQHWVSEGVVWVLINSQGAEEAGSSAEENKAFRRENKIRTPMLLDPTGVVAKAYGAKMTPQLFVISDRGLLVYRGALDNAPNGVVPAREVKTNYVDAALRDLRLGRAVTINETKPYGCAVVFGRP